MEAQNNIHSFSNEVHLEWLNNRMLVVFVNYPTAKAIGLFLAS
ncbi:hypothetical protein [Helicobacter pylori]|nr:hypothetical protein [Helicobacter pylori]